jgi:capsule polysaccharide export protein KpsC/LpsZ
MKHQLRTVTVRIANGMNGSVRAWSDDLPGLSLTSPNHEVLFAELTPKIENILKNRGFESKIVREIHQFVIEVSTIRG